MTPTELRALRLPNTAAPPAGDPVSPSRRAALRALSLAALPAAVAGCGGSDGGSAPVAASAGGTGSTADTPAPGTASGASAPLSVTTRALATGLAYPWSLAFLPDGRMLVTEKPGRLRIVAAGGTVSAPLAGVPPVYFDASAQGGLLDVALSRDFAASRILFFSYSEPYTAAGSRTAVARARFSDAGLTDVQVIFRQDQAVATGIHFGGRIVVAADGTLFIGVGERGERDRAPELGNTRGKVVRIAADGSIPADNPFVGRSGARGEIWSYGHRNPQGMALEPGTGRLWLCEHGPLGGDELNIVQRGADYGWPRITYGREYDTGRPIGQGTSAPDVVAPVHYWVPTSIAPSGLAFYTGTRFPSWQGSVLTGALAGRALARLRLQGDLVVSEERLLATQNERIRDVRMGPDGEVYLLTDAADGRLLTVVAA